MTAPWAGPNITSEYQVSGLPFAITGSTAGVLQFPFVTQWFMVRSTSGTTTVGFTEGGLNGINHFAVTSSSGFSFPVHVKVKELWISSSGYEVLAGLTMVPPNKMWDYIHPPASGSITTNGVTQSYTGFGYNGV